MWKYLAAYLAAVFGGIIHHGGDDIKKDKYGMNQTDRDYIARLKQAVRDGEMSEEEAKAKFISKGGTAEMWDSVDLGSDGLFGESAGVKGVDSGSFQPMDIVQALTAYFTRNHLTGAEREQNEFNAGEAQKSRDFTEFMARNKYSMETQSMQDAGVNPAMVYGGGNLVPTAANGAAASGSPLSGGNIADLLSTFIRLPKEMKELSARIEQAKADAEKARAEGEAAKENAATNRMNAETAARNAATQERQATVAEMRQQVDAAMAESNMSVNDATVTHIAKQCAILDKQFVQMDAYLDIEKVKASAAEKQALASLKQAAAAVQNAATNDYLSNYQSSLMYAQELYQWSEKEGKDIVNQYLDDNQKQQLENMRKEGLKLDAEGRLINKQGNLVDAQTVKTYVNCATDVANSVSRFVGIGAFTNASSNFGRSIQNPSGPYIQPGTGLLFNSTLP